MTDAGAPDLHWLTVAGLAKGFARAEFSPVDVMSALLARIEAANPSLHAFIALDADGALDAARRAEADFAKGNRLGPLHGVPFAVKDVIDIAGMKTTCHSRILLDNVAAADAGAVARLRAAGAIPVGKLASHEFAIGGPSFDLPFPPARNPWNADYHPGGSSSGAGSAVGGGLVPLAVGTDTSGSIRNPAGACGAVGLKPTYGLVSRDGVFPLAWSLDHVGPMCRGVRDAALALDVMADGPAGRAPLADTVEGGVSGLRIGVVRHFHETDMPADPAVSAAIDEAVRVFEGEGAQVTSVRLPDLKLFSAVNRLILQAEGWSIHKHWLQTRPGDYSVSTRRRLLPGALLGADELLHAMKIRRLLIEQVCEVLRDVDLLLTANAMDSSFRIDDEEGLARSYLRQARAPFNLTGHPALVFPAGMFEDGFPVSIQLVGRYYEEAAVLRAARAFERVTPWHERHPVDI